MQDELARLSETRSGDAGGAAPVPPGPRLRRPRLALWLAVLALVAAGLVAARVYGIGLYRVSGASMEPTLHCAGGPHCEAAEPDRILVNRLAFRVREPRRGEIVLLELSGRAATACGGAGAFVKRIVGLPGDELRQEDGRVYLNGERLDEPYVEAPRRGQADLPALIVEDGHYFVMGDNRTSACDSRELGTVPRAGLVGPVTLVYRPLARLRRP